MKKHQEDCFDIAELVYQITEGVLDATHGMKEGEMNGRLVEDLRIFERWVLDILNVDVMLRYNDNPRKLGSIRAKLGLLTKRSLMSKIFRQENMVETLAKFKTELRNQIDIFNVCIYRVWWTQRRCFRLLIWTLYFS